MRILDTNNNELETYDDTLGYLVPEVIIVAHHEAVAEVPEVVELETIWQDKKNKSNKLVKKVVKQKHVPAVEAYDETEDIMRYIAYTTEEIAQRQAEAEAAEAAAQQQAARQAEIDSIPQRMTDAELAIAELGALQLGA